MVSLLLIISHILIFFIRIYQYLISPLFGQHCRFIPTCSQYGIEVIYKFGVIKGIWLTMKRILKCLPLHPGGYDPISTTESSNNREY